MSITGLVFTPCPMENGRFVVGMPIPHSKYFFDCINKCNGPLVNACKICLNTIMPPVRVSDSQLLHAHV